MFDDRLDMLRRRSFGNDLSGLGLDSIRRLSYSDLSTVSKIDSVAPVIIFVALQLLEGHKLQSCAYTYIIPPPFLGHVRILALPGNERDTVHRLKLFIGIVLGRLDGGHALIPYRRLALGRNILRDAL